MSIEVPKLKKAYLFERVASINHPFSETTVDNPLSAPYLFIKTENAGLAKWGGIVAKVINAGMGGDDNNLKLERAIFENSFIAAYDLISYGYQKSSLELPTIATPPDDYSWLGLGSTSTPKEIFGVLNEHQHDAGAEYPDYFEALATWGAERMGSSSPYGVGMTAVAGAEVYLSFRDHQEQVTA
jgi:hypothetical protein